ncbi:MAG TPA: hypothetical protein VEQ58_04650 [Polyangiaceae bacterium]|nr:hypothetical protein [Polyangiaceae bacterium]
MPRELSPFELDRELSRVVPRARAAYRALRSGREVTLHVPEVLKDAETLERVATDKSDPIAPALVRFLYWLELMRRALPREGERVRRYRVERHALDRPLAGHFTWRELLGHALRDAARRPELVDVLLERGDALRDAGSRLYELRAEQPRFGGRSRTELELPHPTPLDAAQLWLASSADAFGSLELRSLADVLEQGLATAAADGWPRQLSLRSLHDLLGSADWLSGLRVNVGELPAPLSAASFVRGLLRLGAAWHDALAPDALPFSLAHDPFGLRRYEHGALFAGIATSPTFLRRQLSLGKERAVGHMRALSRSVLLQSRLLALRVSLGEPALSGPAALREAFSEHGAKALGFEAPPLAAGLLFRPRLGDAQRFAGLLLAAERRRLLAEEHDEDWFRNPRAIEQLRAEAHTPPPTTCSSEALEAGARALRQELSARL